MDVTWLLLIQYSDDCPSGVLDAVWCDEIEARGVNVVVFIIAWINLLLLESWRTRTIICAHILCRIVLINMSDARKCVLSEILDNCEIVQCDGRMTKHLAL